LRGLSQLIASAGSLLSYQARPVRLNDRETETLTWDAPQEMAEIARKVGIARYVFTAKNHGFSAFQAVSFP
jgi:hypothetical protein